MFDCCDHFLYNSFQTTLCARPVAQIPAPHCPASLNFIPDNIIIFLFCHRRSSESCETNTTALLSNNEMRKILSYPPQPAGVGR